MNKKKVREGKKLTPPDPNQVPQQLSLTMQQVEDFLLQPMEILLYSKHAIPALTMKKRQSKGPAIERFLVN